MDEIENGICIVMGFNLDITKFWIIHIFLCNHGETTNIYLHRNKSMGSKFSKTKIK